MHAAIVRLTVLIALAPTLICAGTAATKTALTVLMDFESPHSEASLTALRTSLRSLLNASGMSVSVELKSELPENPQFAELVVFKMKGFCSLSPHVSHNNPDEQGPLGKAFTSNGQVLHFGEVECDRVRGMIQRVVGRNPSTNNEKAYGAALAVVIAHEVYHMMGNVLQHTHNGITKSALSPSELLDSRLALPDSAVSIIHRHDRWVNVKISN